MTDVTQHRTASEARRAHPASPETEAWRDGGEIVENVQRRWS
jgi:hypothetical protein